MLCLSDRKEGNAGRESITVKTQQEVSKGREKEIHPLSCPKKSRQVTPVPGDKCFFQVIHCFERLNENSPRGHYVF